MNPTDIRDISDAQQTSCDLDEFIAQAQRKRAIYPWNDWGKRTSYADLTAGGASLIDQWLDPAFTFDGDPHVWLRAEVWLHPDGTRYRALIHNGGTVVVEPLECCRSPKQTQPTSDRTPPSPSSSMAAGVDIDANTDVWIDAALMTAYDERTAVPDTD